MNEEQSIKLAEYLIGVMPSTTPEQARIASREFQRFEEFDVMSAIDAHARHSPDGFMRLSGLIEAIYIQVRKRNPLYVDQAKIAQPILDEQKEINALCEGLKLNQEEYDTIINAYLATLPESLQKWYAHWTMEQLRDFKSVRAGVFNWLKKNGGIVPSKTTPARAG